MNNRPTRTALAACSLAVLAAVAHAADPKASRYYEDALVRYEKKDLAGAVVQLKNALKLDAGNLSVQALLGRALVESGDYRQADVALTEALRLGVNRVEIVLPLARAMVGQGKPQELLAGERFTLAGLPPRTQYELLLLRAAAATDIGDARAAMQAVDSARAIDANDAGSYLAEAPLRIRTRELGLAAAAAERALVLAPNLADAHYTRSEVLHVQGALDAAEQAYTRALALKPDHVGALVARAGIALDGHRSADAARDIDAALRASPGDPRATYLKAMVAQRSGNAAAAKAALQQVTALLDPVPMDYFRYRPQTLMLGGMAHDGLGEREKAKPYFEAVLRGQPNHAVSKLLANIYLAEKNADRAIETLDTYLRANPGDTQALLLLASAHMSQGRYARATQIVQDALKQPAADATPLRAALGLSLVGNGRYGDAQRELEAAFAKDPGQIQSGYALASLYLQANQPARALQVADLLVRRNPANPGLQNLLGNARRAAGEAAGARTAYEQAARLDAGFTPAQIGLARLDIDARQYDAATTRLKALLTRDEKNVDALAALGEVAERTRRLEDAQRWLEKADDFAGMENLQPALALVDFQLRNGRVDAAREALKRALAKRPDAVPTLVASARVSLAVADAAAARSSLGRAVAAASYNPPLLVQIALLQVQAGALPGAAHALDKALDERPDFVPAQALRADVDLRQGDLASAEQRARALLAKNPRLGVGWGILGDVARTRGQRDAAIDAYRRAHELDKTPDSMLRLFRASVGRDRAGALRLAEQWIKANPGDLTLRRAVADAQFNAGNLAGARSGYEALARIAPDDAEALNNLANVLLQQKDPSALQVAEQALARSPAAAHVIGTTGWAAFKAGQHDRAIQLLRDARLRDPSNADTRYFLGAVLASQGRAAEARDELGVALKGTARFEHRAAAEQLMATLR